QDSGIPLESVEKMKAALAKGSDAAKASEFVVYPDAPHAFHADYRSSYREEAARDGWNRAVAWFNRLLAEARRGGAAGIRPLPLCRLQQPAVVAEPARHAPAWPARRQHRVRNQFAAKQDQPPPLRRDTQPFLLRVVGFEEAELAAVVGLTVGREVQNEGDASVRLAAVLVEVSGVAFARVVS